MEERLPLICMLKVLSSLEEDSWIIHPVNEYEPIAKVLHLLIDTPLFLRVSLGKCFGVHPIQAEVL